MDRPVVRSSRPVWLLLALLAAACSGDHRSTPPGDATPPSVRASPAGGSFPAPVTVSLLCDDGGGSGCAAVRFATDGSAPTATSPAYASPIAIATTTELRFFAVDAAGNASAVRSEAYAIDASPSGIAAIRAAPDGPIEVPIAAATVTYLKPAAGGAPAGFFLQEDPPGPGVFAAIDPATLSPAPAVGDAVSFTATARQRVGGVVEITGMSSFAVVATGRDVERLRADVSGVADLPALVDAYESELVSITGTVTGPYALGFGFAGGLLETAGTPASPSLIIRVPVPVRDATDLVIGCAVTVRAPLWRYGSQIQATAWTIADLTLHTCPAPRVVSAVATTPTSVTVTFDRHVDPASVASDGSQLAFTDGLVATAASVSGKTVQVTTSAQVKAHPYTVAVPGSVRDTVGTPVDATASSATFLGHRNPALLRLTEVAPEIGNDRDVIELLVLRDGATVGMTLVQDSTGVLATFPDAWVVAGDLIVVHLNPVVGGLLDAPGSETLAKDQYPSVTHAWNYDGAWDFHGGSSGVYFSNQVLRIADPTGATQDGAAFTALWALGPPESFPAALQRLQAEGQWLPADCGGTPCTYSSTPSATDPTISASWDGVTFDRSITVRRVDPWKDADRASDWAVGPSSLGAL